MGVAMSERPPQETLETMRKALDRSKRTSSVRLPIEFARDRTTEYPQPPLAYMLRGGGHQLPTYLAILMMATKVPHSTKVSTTSLAAMLHPEGVTDAGRRRIAKEIKDLESRVPPLLRVDRPRGKVPEITVLHPNGSGREWSVSDLPKPYLTLPIELWRNGWALMLSPRALGLFIILRELTHGRAGDAAWVDPIRKKQYGLSNDTWTRATGELVRTGLLEVSEEVLMWQGEPRRRNLYKLQVGFLQAAMPGDFS